MFQITKMELKRDWSYAFFQTEILLSWVNTEQVIETFEHSKVELNRLLGKKLKDNAHL